jgi:hypothetical protein
VGGGCELCGVGGELGKGREGKNLGDPRGTLWSVMAVGDACWRGWRSVPVSWESREMWRDLVGEVGWGGNVTLEWILTASRRVIDKGRDLRCCVL